MSEHADRHIRYDEVDRTEWSWPRLPSGMDTPRVRTARSKGRARRRGSYRPLRSAETSTGRRGMGRATERRPLLPRSRERHIAPPLSGVDPRSVGE